MLEWLAVALPIIADNVLNYTLDQSGLGEKLREKIKPDTTKAALQHALMNDISEHVRSDAASSLGQVNVDV